MVCDRHTKNNFSVHSRRVILPAFIDANVPQQIGAVNVCSLAGYVQLNVAVCIYDCGVCSSANSKTTCAERGVWSAPLKITALLYAFPHACAHLCAHHMYMHMSFNM